MGLFTRLGRITRASYKSCMDFFKLLLTPYSKQSIHVDQVKDIFKDGATYQAEYSQILTLIKYAKDRNTTLENRVNIKDIVDITLESNLDLPIELISLDLKRWQKNQRRIQILKDSFIKYLFFSTFIIILNLINGTLLLAFYPLSAWGIGLLVLASNIYRIKTQESIELMELSKNDEILEKLKKHYVEEKEEI